MSVPWLAQNKEKLKVLLFCFSVDNINFYVPLQVIFILVMGHDFLCCNVNSLLPMLFISDHYDLTKWEL